MGAVKLDKYRSDAILLQGCWPKLFTSRDGRHEEELNHNKTGSRRNRQSEHALVFARCKPPLTTSGGARESRVRRRLANVDG